MSILPGTTLGILGGGQLGRMLAMAAKRMGYAVHVFSPEADTPAGQVADVETVASYEDAQALTRFAQDVDVVTIEFENIPVSALLVLQAEVPVYPQPPVLYVAQNRLREKCFLVETGLPVAPFYEIQTTDDLAEAIETVGVPAVLKTAGFGYDGKGQAKVNSLAELQAVYAELGEPHCILEAFIELEREISVIAARNFSKENAPGQFVAYAPVENRHKNHILDVTLAPAEIPDHLSQQAIAIARDIMETLDMRGLLCVEFFVTAEGRLLVNELAPRPHNSGHYTMEAAVTGQFEQQLRAVCGLPLGDASLRSPAAMLNLLGDAWSRQATLAGEPDWAAALAVPGISLHLYGKHEPRLGRKMGHLTALGETPETALVALRQAEAALRRQSLKVLDGL